MSGCTKIEELEKLILWQTQYLQKLPFQISYHFPNFRFLISCQISDFLSIAKGIESLPQTLIF